MKKRIVCLLLTALLLCTLSACKKGKKDGKPVTDGDTVDVEYYVKLGQMPECQYRLGSELAKLRKELAEAAETAESGEEDDESSSYFNEYSPMEGVTGISTGNFDYYYRTAREADGVAYLVCYGDAYGFETGTLGNEIKERLSAFDTAERDADAGELFFLPSITQFTVLEYPFGENVVLFVLQDNALCATALYRPSLWSEETV